ncbi:MAG: hypothetical protein ABIF82_10775 [Planctomycetota bacterium]
MRTACSIALCALIAVCAGRASAAASGIDKTLSCRVRVGLGANVRFGNMLPVFFEFENAGEPRTIQVRTTGASQISAVFSVPKGGGIRRCLYVPVHTDIRYYGPESVAFSDAGSGRVLRRMDISGQTRSINVHGGSSGHTSTGPTLIGLSIARSTALTINSDMLTPFAFDVSHVLAGAGLPDSWLGYSGIDVVVVEHDAWAEPEFNKKPLIDWMAMGGICMMVDAPPDARTDLAKQLAAEAAFLDAPGGPADDKDSAAEKRQPKTYFVGMGGLTFVDTKFLSTPHKNVLAGLGLRAAADSRLTEATRQAYPRVQGVDSPPFWSVLVALVVFAALVGPLGWWYLIKKKGRLLLYYAAAPAASFCAIVLTITAAMFNEGFTPYVNCVAVRFIDQRVKKRIDLSQFGVYVPFGFGTSLTGAATELPHFLGAGEDEDRDGPLTLVSRPSGRGREYEGVLPPRTQVWFGRELITLERRRLVVWEDGGTLFAENHLGCSLKALVVSHKGKFAYFDRLSEGAKGSAPLVGETAIRTRRAANESAVDNVIRCLVPRKSRDLALDRWRRMFENGNAYAAQAEGLTNEHVWLSSFKDQGTQCAIFGVY